LGEKAWRFLRERVELGVVVAGPTAEDAVRTSTITEASLAVRRAYGLPGGSVDRVH